MVGKEMTHFEEAVTQITFMVKVAKMSSMEEQEMTI